LELFPFGPDERELAALRGGEGEQLDAEREDGRRELCELRPERRPENSPLRRRLAQRQRAPPRATADEPRRERDLADRSPAALGAGEDPVEQCVQGAPERELVSDRLRELQPLRDLGCGRARPDACVPLVPRQAPGA